MYNRDNKHGCLSKMYQALPPFFFWGVEIVIHEIIVRKKEEPGDEGIIIIIYLHVPETHNYDVQVHHTMYIILADAKLI